MKSIFLLLAVLGAVIPCLFFGDFILKEGVDLATFVQQLFANSPASGFTADLLITSTAFWIWSFSEARRLRMKHWWLYVVANLSIGLSFAFPLFLYFRQRKQGVEKAIE